MLRILEALPRLFGAAALLLSVYGASAQTVGNEASPAARDRFDGSPAAGAPAGVGAGTHGSGKPATLPGHAAARRPFFLHGDSQISQAVAFAAGTYTLSFYAAGRGRQSQPVQVSIDGIPIGPPITPASDSYELYTTVAFTTVAGTRTVQFSATNSNRNSITLIDRVSVNLVTGPSPEPTPNPPPPPAPVVTAKLYYVHTDHLNTPRVITNESRQVVWRWDNLDAFGANMPDENPSGLGNFTCNLRLPGQYFDRETNLHYNYFRDYDPGIGRYAQSDPIGLLGGINTYVYAKNDVIRSTDPNGLLVCGPEDSWTKHVIPDNWYAPSVGLPIFMFSFTNCCRDHDHCYGRQCDLTKVRCDTDFHACMRRECNTANGSVKPLCLLAARAYFELVTTTATAQKAFDTSRASCNACRP